MADEAVGAGDGIALGEAEAESAFFGIVCAISGKQRARLTTPTQLMRLVFCFIIWAFGEWTKLGGFFFNPFIGSA